MNEKTRQYWKAVCLERCMYSLEEGSRSSTTAMGQLVGFLSYIESNFNAQRRLADWHFEKAQTWEDLLAAHEKWLLDFNYQHHFAHEQREDGCHSPAAVLGWVKGMQPEPERIYRAFSTVGEMRTITKAGYGLTLK